MKRRFLDLLRKKLKVRSLTYLKNKYKRKLDQAIYKKEISDEDFKNKFTSLGIKKGDTILLHSSWDEFYNYKGSPEQFIDLLLEIIGSEGTLMMPSYPLLRKKTSVFNLKTTPTKAGLLPEVFRRYLPVARSVDPHSVVAYGKYAEFLTKDHIKSETFWDEHSPYYKLGEIGGKAISMGIGKHHVGTVMHCADSILQRELSYFKLFFTKQDSMTFKLMNGELFEKTFLTKEDDFYYSFTERFHWKVIKKYFDKEYYQLGKLSNIDITVFDAKYTINRSTEIGRKGIVVYTEPNPKNYKF